ncbi:MAG: hypothetical protein M3Q34_01145 [bacterium]|nr:hypothetical protein [bacterium]
MKNKLKGFLVFAALLLVVMAPFAFVFAQAPNETVESNECSGYEVGANQNSVLFALCRISLILNTLVPIIIVLGVVYFMYGVISYAIAKDDEAKTAGRGAMINGLIALLVITSIWGLVKILKTTFGVTNDSAIQVPCIASPGVTCPQ